MATVAILGKIPSDKRKLGLFRRVLFRRLHVISSKDLSESFEDAQLNAIADERKEGPFVKVRLSDL